MTNTNYEKHGCVKIVIQLAHLYKQEKNEVTCGQICVFVGDEHVWIIFSLAPILLYLRPAKLLFPTVLWAATINNETSFQSRNSLDLSSIAMCTIEDIYQRVNITVDKRLTG
jgi:hypothetical protein